MRTKFLLLLLDYDVKCLLVIPTGSNRMRSVNELITSSRNFEPIFVL